MIKTFPRLFIFEKLLSCLIRPRGEIMLPKTPAVITCVKSIYLVSVLNENVGSNLSYFHRVRSAILSF